MHIIPNRGDVIDRRIITLYLVTAATCLLHLLPFFLPECRLWGMNHLLFLSPTAVYIYVAALLVAFAFLMPPLDAIGRRIFSAGAVVLDRPHYGIWALIALLATIPFFIFRMPTNFLGDGYTVINNIGNDLPVLYKRTELGAIAIVDGLNRLLPLGSLESSTLAFAIVSVISGGVTIFFFFAIASELAAEPEKRLFISLSLLFSGWLLLFFGYAENYPIIWPFLTAYIFLALRYLNEKGGLVWPTLLLLLATLMHVQTLFFAVSYLPLLIHRGPAARLYRHHRRLLLGGAAIIALAGAGYMIYRYNTVAAFRVHILPPFGGRPPATDYGILTPAHLLDIANELLLLIPLGLLFLIVGWRGMIAFLKTAPGRFLAVFSLGGFMLLLLIDPRLGMARDWDLFALTALGPGLILVCGMLHSSTPAIVRKYLGLTALAAVLIAPFFIVNLSYQPSIDYYSWLLKLDVKKGRSGLGGLTDFYANQGQTEVVDSLHQVMLERYPHVGLLREAQECFFTGDYERAWLIADSVLKLEPYSPEPYALRGTIFLLAEDFSRAIDDFNQALAFSPDNIGNNMNMGQAYLNMGRYRGALPYYRRALELVPNSVQALQGMGSGYYWLTQYDSALVYLALAIDVMPEQADPYLMAGYCAYYLRDREKTRLYWTRYLELNPEAPERADIMEMLRKMR